MIFLKYAVHNNMHELKTECWTKRALDKRDCTIWSYLSKVQNRQNSSIIVETGFHSSETEKNYRKITEKNYRQKKGRAVETPEGSLMAV